MLPSADAATRPDTASAAVLAFIHVAGVLFVTVRRRGQRIVASGFHLNRLSTSMVIKVDFDLAVTTVACHLYQLLAFDLPPCHRRLTARTLFQTMLSAGTGVELAPDRCTVALKKKRNLPARLRTLQAQDPVRILWLGNRRIQFQGATRS